MNNIKNIAFVTGSRADYGIMRNFLALMNKDPQINLSILATGALLDDTYGHQVDLIYNDGFTVATEIKVDIDTTSTKNILKTMSMVQDKFADYFADNEPDLLMILGDRYEMLSVAIAAAMQKIPILHIHGGEATFGNYDEFIRHAITKMSLYHFTVTDEYMQRVIQLGENPKKVFNLGSLGAENCTKIDNNNVNTEVLRLPVKEYFVVLFHPETLTNISVSHQMDELLSAIEQFSDTKFVFIGTNADTNSNIIREKVKMYVERNENTVYFENLHTDAYHYLLKNAIGLIGNSSSGIIEAPSLGIFTINIGDRQKGRVRGNSVVDVKCIQREIVKAIDYVLDNYLEVRPINPYYRGDSASLYYMTIKKILSCLEKDIEEPKIFYDLKTE